MGAPAVRVTGEYDIRVSTSRERWSLSMLAGDGARRVVRGEALAGPGGRPGVLQAEYSRLPVWPQGWWPGRTDNRGLILSLPCFRRMLSLPCFRRMLSRPCFRWSRRVAPPHGRHPRLAVPGGNITMRNWRVNAPSGAGA